MRFSTGGVIRDYPFFHVNFHVIRDLPLFLSVIRESVFPRDRDFDKKLYVIRDRRCEIYMNA